MASLDQAARPATGTNRQVSATKPRVKRHAFRLDMTPMVDLAFLLLTFFMLTTTFTKARAMDLQMPVRDLEQPNPVKAHDALTLLLGARHRVYYYVGLSRPADPTVPVPTLRQTDFSAQGLRQVLLARRRQNPQTIVLLKALPTASYQDLVSALDEMNITGQQQYALTDLAAADRALLPPGADQL